MQADILSMQRRTMEALELARQKPAARPVGFNQFGQLFQPVRPQVAQPVWPAQPSFDWDSAITAALRQTIFAAWERKSPDTLLAFKLGEMAMDSPQFPSWVREGGRWLALFAILAALDDANKPTKRKR